MLHKIFTTLFFAFFLSGLQAQVSSLRSVVATAGKDTLIGTTIWNCTIGEPAIETLANGSNVFTQGFNQPDGFKITPGLPYVQDLVIYPNPAHSNSTLRFYLKVDKAQITINIYDAAGKLYQSQTLQSYAGQTFHSLNPQAMASGTYLVKVIAGSDVFVGKLVIIN